MITFIFKFMPLFFIIAFTHFSFQEETYKIEFPKCQAKRRFSKVSYRPDSNPSYVCSFCYGS